MTLREMRERSGLRQEDVGNRLNLDQTAVSNWERGKTKPLRKYHRQLAKMYSVSEEELQHALGCKAVSLKSDAGKFIEFLDGVAEEK